MQQESRFSCFKCKEELIFDVKIGRRDMCPNCGAYLHCCKNCRFYDPNVHNQCTENQGEFIRDREEGNFCLYFEFHPLGEDRSAEVDAARSKLDALFGGGGAVAPKALSPADDARARLDALFGKK